ncbi:dentin sialophosphoprotein isoform X2 [Hydra vulgaris]|uniref:Dentin sialophosphoprotein isoform X2 n=1 Tax=Hydra vulgaris TaxID=6087 RepID=A0ABM4CWA7_HYDVU
MKMKQAQIIFTILAIAISKRKVSTITSIDSQAKNDFSLPTNENVEQDVSRSYVQKFSQSWNFFAKANDISKRERLKKALSDALQSMEYKKRNDIAVNINSESVSRIKNAAKLLKEFREMYSLSDKVKKTLQDYSKARKDLKLIANFKASDLILKRFLDLHSHKDNKRTNIPSANIIGLRSPKYLTKTDTISLKAVPLDKNGNIGLEFSSIDTRSSSMKRAIEAFRAAKIILNYETTIRSHINSNPFHNKTSINNLETDSDLEFTKSSNKRSEFPDLLKSKNSTNATNDINYIKDTTLSTKSNNETSNETSSNKTLNNETKDTEVNNRTANEMVGTPDNSGTVNQTVDTTNSSGAAIETIGTTNNSEATNETVDTTNNSEAAKESTDTTNNSEAANEILDTEGMSRTTKDRSNHNSRTNNTNDLSKKIKPFVELLKKIGVKNFLKKMKTMGLNTQDSVNTRDNTRDKINTANKIRVEEPNRNITLAKPIESNNPEDETLKENSKEIIEQIKHDDDLIKKEKMTVERLKEAKIARQKYEIAKHELAKKVKELYDLANDFEKEETQDQFLEVKKSSTSVPFAKNQKSEQQTKYDEFKSVSIKRSDSHPGIALAGILHKEPSILNTEGSDSINKGLTMGMIDKTAHQVKLDEVKTVADGHMTTKINGAEDSHKDSNSEETFKQIAQAINVGISKISKDDIKGKSLLKIANLPATTDAKQNKNIVLMVTNSTNKDSISNGHTTENIDEFLTKALTDIISNSSAQGKDYMIKDKGLESSKQNEENRKIVEKAMKAHAANPHVELPLLKKNGDTIIPNKDAKLEDQKDREKVKQLIFPTSIFNNSPKNNSAQNDGLANYAEENLSKLVAEDPNNKALLDKASHMEEQVAAAQERLFSTLADSSDKDNSVPATGSSVLTPNLVKTNSHSTSDEIFPQALTSPGFTETENTEHSHNFLNSNNEQSLRYLNNDREGDPYSSIKEENLPYEVPLTRHTSQVDEAPEEDDDDDEEDHYRVSRRRHHHHYMPEPDEDDDGNEDDEYDDDELPYEDKRKRTLLNKQMLSTKNKTISGIHNFILSPKILSHDKSNEFLEDESKKSIILGGKINTQMNQTRKSAKN